MQDPKASPDSLTAAPGPATVPNCPACGYSRATLAMDALCPECGAQGFEGAIVLAGGARNLGVLSKAALLVWTVVPIGLAVVSMRGGFRMDELVCVGFAALPGVAIGIHLWRQRGAAAHGIVWTVHPQGIEVREGAARQWFERASIGDIRCADSITGRSSQLMLVPRRLSSQGMLGRTRVIYIHGTVEERRGMLRRIRAVLGM